jgi:hypothetical protein
MELININKYLEKTNYKDILQLLENKIQFYKFIEIINSNFDSFNLLRLELIIKLILNKITRFEGNVDSDSFQIFYDKLKNKNDINFHLLNSFITKFDKYKEIKLNFISLNFQMIKIFKNQFNKLNLYSNKDHITKEDINNIKNIIDEEILLYYNSFFEVNYNKFFFKRIIDAKLELTREIHTTEMIYRIVKIVELFTLKMLETLKVQIITIADFWKLPYLERVNYYRQLHIKTNAMFKLYFTFYNQINEIFYEISILTHIDPLNYIEMIHDSTSSYAISEDDLEIDMENFEDSYHFKTNVVNLTNEFNDIDYDNDSKDTFFDDNIDTPIMVFDNITKKNEDENEDENNQDDDNPDEEDILDDDDNSIDNIFIKN